MNAFEITSVIIASLGLLGGIVAVYVKMQIEVAKINVEIRHLQHDLDQKEVTILKVEKNNREDHEKILNKIDKLIEK